MDFVEAVQMGNLFASMFIKAPLGDRYCIKPYEVMLKTVRQGCTKKAAQRDGPRPREDRTRLLQT